MSSVVSPVSRAAAITVIRMVMGPSSPAENNSSNTSESNEYHDGDDEGRRQHAGSGEFPTVAGTDAATVPSSPPPRPEATAAAAAAAVVAVAVAAVGAELGASLAETTHNVLAFFYPQRTKPLKDGGHGDAATDIVVVADSPTNSTASASTSAFSSAAHLQHQQPSDDDRHDLRFLDRADALARTTLPSGAAASNTASDDATADDSLLHLVRLLARLAGPVAVTQILRTSMGIVTTAFMGHYLTTAQFAAAATGLSFTNLTALNIGNGFAAALDTLATQENGRRRHSPEIVAILIRGVICTLCVYVPIAILYWFCKPALALVIHADLVDDTAYFLRMSVFIATPMILNNNLIKFAQAQKVTQLGLVASATSIAILPSLLFTFGPFGIKGIIIALSIDRFTELLMVIFFLLRNPGLSQCWRGRSLRAHIMAVVRNPAELVRFVGVGLPILGANCADSWAFETLAIIAAHIGPTSAAAWNVVMAIYNQFFALHIGLAAAAAIRVGNAVGAGKGYLARKYVLATIVLSTSCTSFCVAAIWVLGKRMFQLLQRSEEVSERGGEITFLAGLTFAADSLFYVLQGPFRGVGYNGVLLFIVATGMWGITVPLGIILGVVQDYDVEGILVALGLGMVLTAPAQIGFLLCGIPWGSFERAPSSEQEEQQQSPVIVAVDEDEDDETDEARRRGGRDSDTREAAAAVVQA